MQLGPAPESRFVLSGREIRKPLLACVTLIFKRPPVFVIVLATMFAAPVFAQPDDSPDCRISAYLPPMATLGGAGTAAPGGAELGLAFGGYGEILPNPCIHTGGLDWLVRWRRGISNRIDLGFDFLTNSQADGTIGGTAKAAVRYRVTSGFRLEAGVGAADGGDGGNVNGDIAAVLGTHNSDHSWNYYMSLRLGAARGCLGCGNNVDHAPGALVPLGAIGATARVSDNVRFVMEGGIGEVFARQYSAPAGYVHLSFGVLFNAGKSRR